MSVLSHLDVVFEMTLVFFFQQITNDSCDHVINYTFPSFYGVSFPVAQLCQDNARWWCCPAAQQVPGCSCCSSSAVPALCPVLSAASRSPCLAGCSGAVTLARWHPPLSCSCKSSGKPRPAWPSGCVPWHSEPAPCLWRQRDTITGDTGQPFPFGCEGFCNAPALSEV